MNIRNSVGIVLLLLFFSSLSFAAQVTAPVEPEHWSNALRSSTNNGGKISNWDRLGDQASDAIFDLIEDLDIYSFGNENFSAKLKVHRRVFDNADILNSWTVVDRFELGGSIPIYSTAISSAIFGSTPGFSIGSSVGMEFINIRQVRSKDYAKFPSELEVGQKISEEPWLKEFKNIRDEPAPTGPFPGEWQEVTDLQGRKKKSFTPRDPENHARYSRLWNMVTFPFRFPIRAEYLSRLEAGEIVSYLGRGGVTMGANVGWDLDPSQLTGLAQAGVSWSTTLSGNWRVSILKEDDRYVRLKVTRAASLGDSFSVGSDYKSTLLDGVFVLDGLQGNTRIIPFSFSTSHSAARSFDVGYRYDMTIPEARAAFEKAVLGHLSDSEALAVDERGKDTDFSVTGVHKQFIRRATSKNRGISSKMRLGFIWRKDRSASHTDVNTVVTLPDGTHHVFSASSVASNGWRTVWGNRENRQYNIAVNVDLDVLEKTGSCNKSMNLIFEGRLQDNSTSHRELLKYFGEVESSVDKENLFPRPADVENVGKTSFYYQLGFSSEQLLKFINYPDNQMWGALEKAFGVKDGAWSTKIRRTRYLLTRSGLSLLNLPLIGTGYNIHQGSNLWHARRIFKQWKKLKTIEEERKLAEALGHLFYDRIYSPEMLGLLRHVLDGETVQYYAMGTSRAFGRIISQGGTQIAFDNIASRVKREVEFDAEEGRTQDYDPQASMQEVSATVIDADHIEILFTLQKEPAQFFIQLMLSNPWWPLKNGEQAAMLVKNKGQFVVGQNRILIDRTDQESPWLPLAAALQTGQVYRINMAVNNDSVRWGSVSSVRFKLR